MEKFKAWTLQLEEAKERKIPAKEFYGFNIPAGEFYGLHTPVVV